MKDALGDRMKSNYENRTRIFLPRRTYTLIRVDGKAFHTYTKNLKRPFDDGLMKDMDSTAAYLCKNIMGAQFAFVQSDEISILITDFEDINTEAWFDNNLQKMCSISASQATAIFNWLRMQRYFCGPENNIVPEKIYGRNIGEHYEPGTNLENVHDDISSFINYMPLGKPYIAEFDSRVWQIPQKVEVENYFINRQQDATRNSLSSVAQHLYNHKELIGKNSEQLQEMIFQKGTNWNNYESKYKRGRIILKESYEKTPDVFDKNNNGNVISEPVIRTRWVSKFVPVFTQDRAFLSEKIPNNN